MVLFLNAEVFDFAVIHSNTRISLPIVSSLMEELKLLCPNKAVTQSRWLEVTTGKMTVAEAQCYWSVFAAARASILGQFGDWIDMQTLGILLVCQCFPNARARADSFHRSELLAQSLATTAVSTSPVSMAPALARAPSRTNISKLLRDNSSISQFVAENLELVADDDLEVKAEQIEKLGILFLNPMDEVLKSLVEQETVLKASILGSRLAELVAWNSDLYPQYDLAGKAENSRYTFREFESVYIMNQTKTTIILSDRARKCLPNIYVVNCSDVTIYIPDAAFNLSIFGCVDSEIVAMAITGSTILSFSDRVVLRSVSSYARLDNSTDCRVFAYTSKGTVLTGDTRGIELGPFNVFFSRHEGLLETTGLLADSSHASLWSQPINSTLSEQPYLLQPPDKFNLVRFPEFGPHASRRFAVPLPQVYADALEAKNHEIQKLRSEIASIPDEANVAKVNSILSGHFREWLSVNNKTKSLIEIIRSGDSY